MGEVLAVARSLVTDRTYLLIPAWVCVAGLVLAAALIRVSDARFWRVLTVTALCIPARTPFVRLFVELESR